MYYDDRPKKMSLRHNITNDSFLLIAVSRLNSSNVKCSPSFKK